MMPNIDFEKCLTECIKKNNEIIEDLNKLIHQAEHFQKENNEKKTVGTLSGVAGGITTVASVIAAPFTGGISAAGIISGGILSLFGGGLNFTAGRNDRHLSEKIIDTIKNLLDSREILISKLKEQINLFDHLVESLVSNDVNPEIAKSTLLQGIANGSIDLKNASSNDLKFKTTLCAARLLEIDAPVIAECALLTNTNSKNPSYVFAASLRVTTGIFRTISTGLAILSIAFIAVDIQSLIQGWTTDHPTVAVINDVIKQLNDEIASYENFISIIDSFKERVHLSLIDNIPIIGSIYECNDVTMALFNNDIFKCKEILEPLQIDWLFGKRFTSTELATFIVHYNIAPRFDKQEVEAIINKTDKQGRQTVELKVESLLSEMEDLYSQIERSNNDGRIRQGAHIINTDVLSVYKNIIEEFVQHKYGITFADLSKIPHNSQIYKDYHQSCPDHIHDNIDNIMKTYIPNDITYINSNALTYTVLIYSLRHSAKLHMDELYNDIDIQESIHISKIKSTIAIMNRFSIFVDYIAKEYWLRQGRTLTTFEDSRLEVQAMFSNLTDKFEQWVEELRRYMDHTHTGSYEVSI